MAGKSNYHQPNFVDFYALPSPGKVSKKTVIGIRVKKPLWRRDFRT